MIRCIIASRVQGGTAQALLHWQLSENHIATWKGTLPLMSGSWFFIPFNIWPIFPVVLCHGMYMTHISIITGISSKTIVPYSGTPWTNQAVTRLIQPPLWPCNVHSEVFCHLLQEPHTLHNAVESDALPARYSTGCTEQGFFEWLFNLWLRRWTCTEFVSFKIL